MKKNKKITQDKKKNDESTKLPTTSKFNLFRLSRFFVFALLVALLAFVFAFFLQSKSNSSVPSSDIFEKNITAQNLISCRNRLYDSCMRQPNISATLAYVTPWNSHGYDVAKWWGNCKLTHISPVWYNIQADSANNQLEFFFTGDHDVDINWIKEVKGEANREKSGFIPKIVPRFLFALQAHQIHQFFLNEKASSDALTSRLIDECKTRGWDGLVFEYWVQIGAFLKHNERYRRQAYNIIHHIAKSLHKNGLIIILPIPPHEELFNSNDLANLGSDIDYFSLMTYDYSTLMNPGPNAPINWVEDKIEDLLDIKSNNQWRSKILMGLNFYGYDFTIPFGGRPIVGHEIINLLSQYDPKFEWHQYFCEHSFHYSEALTETSKSHQKHQVFYPTPYSIKLRVELAQKLGIGLSIWEVGQGLDCFYDLL